MRISLFFLVSALLCYGTTSFADDTAPWNMAPPTPPANPDKVAERLQQLEAERLEAASVAAE